VVVHLKVDYNVIIARLSGRRQCPTCGALYSVTSNAPTVSEVCDYDGSKLVVREDDREEVVRERLRAYEKQTTPVLDFLRGSGYTVLDVEGAGRVSSGDRQAN
jgi:adenylate kinase